MQNIEIKNLDILKYPDALEIMNAHHARISSDPQANNLLLIVEHPPVITMGNRELSHDLLVTTEHLSNLGIEFAKIDRGGSLTAHELGQIVLYPLLKIDAKMLTVKKLVWLLEEAMIKLCANYGINAARDPINPGVWVEHNKIGAIGIRISNHVSKHGIAFNATNNLSTFKFITPCGLKMRGVTSLQKEISRNNSKAEMLQIENLKLELAKIFVNLCTN